MEVGRVIFDSYNPPHVADAEPFPPFCWHDLFATIGELYCALWLLDVIWRVGARLFRP